jgi:hypothetical protein
MCATRVPRKTGQIIRRGSSIWLVRLYVGRDPEDRRRKDIGNSSTEGCGPHRPTSTLAERDLGPQHSVAPGTAGQYLEHWLNISS